MPGTLSPSLDVLNLTLEPTMQDYLITFTVETVNIDAKTLHARLVAFIESGELCLENTLGECAEIDPDTVQVSPTS